MHQLSHNLNQWWLIINWTAWGKFQWNLYQNTKKKKKKLLGLNSHLPRSRWLQNLRNVHDFTCDPQNECMPSPLFRGGSCTKLNSAKELCRASNLIIAVRDKNTTRSWTLISGCKDFLCMCPANERRRYSVMSALIGWAHTQNNPWGCLEN